MDIPLRLEHGGLPPATVGRVSERQDGPAAGSFPLTDWAVATVAGHFTSCIIPWAHHATPLQTNRNVRRWLRRSYSGPDGGLAHIADDRAGLFWEVHSIALG